MVVQLFLLCGTGKEKDWQKENRMKTGTFLKKVAKSQHTITRNPCKVTYVKIKLSRAASYGNCRFQCIQIGRQSDQHPLTLFIFPR